MRQIPSSSCPVGTLHCIGYTQPDATTQIVHLMQQPRTLLFDIRFRPQSRWHPEWNRRALTCTYGKRYHWDQRLGNSNYRHRELGIQLADGHEQAIQAAAALLCAGTSLILLCACSNPETCHRTAVATLIQDALSRIEHPEEVPL